MATLLHNFLLSKNHLLEMPLEFRRNSKFPVLEKITVDIANNPAMRIEQPHIRDNMIRASLIFTICFYGNLLAMVRFYLDKLYDASPFAVQTNTNQLYLFLNLASGELATENIPTKDKNFAPHFVSMLEAAKSAGIDTSKIERFISEMHKPSPTIRKACRKAGFGKEVTDYLMYSHECTKTFNKSFATIALRELTLMNNFQIIVDHLPKDKKYDKYRVFLNTHIMVDSHHHSKLMTEALKEYPNPKEGLETMIQFYTLRNRVYDACLSKKLLF